MSQRLLDTTATATLDVTRGFQMRWEYRRDGASTAYFATRNPEARKREQNTALMGLIWWFGGKQGAWWGRHKEKRPGISPAAPSS